MSGISIGGPGVDAVGAPVASCEVDASGTGAPRTGPSGRGVRAALALLGIAALEALILVVIPGRRGWFDVGVYYGTVHYWVDGGGLLYDYLRPGTTYGFTYPPFAAICMLPMAVLGWHPTVAVSVALNAAATVALVYWLVDPIARRRGWHRGYAFAAAVCLVAALEPVRDTFSFGQVNLLLTLLVVADLRLLPRGSRYAGSGIGLATAIKLTPVIFIGYLLLARRPRAAATAAATAVAATLLACLVLPAESRVYWTEALWDTGRIGVLGYVSNQSLLGLVARLRPGPPDHAVWLAAVVVVLAVWAYRSRRAARSGNDLAGFALTGVTACLVSPITWVHHLVWLVPALVLLADSGLASPSGGSPTRGSVAWPSRQRRRLMGAVLCYAMLCGGVVWLWSPIPAGPGGFLGGNADVWVCLGLLVGLPVTGPATPSSTATGRTGRTAPPRAVFRAGVSRQWLAVVRDPGARGRRWVFTRGRS